MVGKTFDEAMVVCREKSLLLMAINRGGAPGTGPDVDPEGGLEARGQAALEPKPMQKLLTNPSTPEDRGYRIEAGDSLLVLAHNSRPLAEVFGSPMSWRKAFHK